MKIGDHVKPVQNQPAKQLGTTRKRNIFFSKKRFRDQFYTLRNSLMFFIFLTTGYKVL